MRNVATTLLAAATGFALCAGTAFASVSGPLGSVIEGTAAQATVQSFIPMALSASALNIGGKITVDGIVYTVTATGDNPTVKVGGYKTANTASAMSSGYKGGSVSIPATVQDGGVTYQVTTIDKYAFYGDTSMTTLNIAEGVQTVDNYAFAACTSLTYANLPASATKVGTTSGDYTGGSYVFYGCTALKEASFGRGVSGGSVSLASRCFTGCSSLEQVDLCGNVSSLAANAFHTVTSLKRIVGIDAVTSIGRQCFYGCTALVRFSSSGKDQIDFTNSGLVLGSDLFYNGGPSQTLYISGDVATKLNGGYGKQYGPFRMSQIKNAVLTGEWDTIPQGLFYDAVGLESVAVPNAVSAIGSETFYGCTALKSISIPASCSSIGSSAFCSCQSLVSVNFDKGCGAMTIGSNCFLDCFALKSITFPEGTTALPDGCFSGCTGLEYVGLPSTVTSIGAQCFSSVITTGSSTSWIGVQSTEHGVCEALTTIDFDGKVEDLGAQAFYGCKNLKGTIDLSPLTEIPSQTFTGCESLERVIVNPELTKIGTQAFFGCKSMTGMGASASASGIQIPNTVTSLGEYCFAQCTKAPSAVLPAGLASLPRGLFRECSSLKSVEIPADVEKMGAEIFYGCSSLTEVKLPQGLIAVYNDSFAGCTSLTSIELPEGVASLGESAFSGCVNLLTVTMPKSLVSIGAQAFYNCQRLAWVDFTAVDAAGLAIAADAFNTNNAYSKYIFEGESLPAGFTPGNGHVYQVILGDTDYKGGSVNPYKILCDGKAADSSEYKITYSNNTAVGRASATILVGSCQLQREFDITAWSWDAKKIALEQTTFAFTGNPIEPNVNVEGLEKGVGYSLSYTNNVNLGTATVTVTPAAASIGTPVTLSYEIVVEKGAVYTAGNLGYAVLNPAANGKGTLSVTSFTGTTAATVPALVKIGGASFKVTTVAASAFKGNTKLTQLTLGSNVSTIAASAFNGCKKLAKVLFMNTALPTVGAKAFTGVKAKIAVGTKGNPTKLRKLLLKKGLPSTATVVKA